MAHVDRVVHTESDCDDDVDGAHDINGDAPGVHEPTDIHQAESHSQQDQDGSKNICQEYQSCHEHTCESYA